MKTLGKAYFLAALALASTLVVGCAPPPPPPPPQPAALPPPPPPPQPPAAAPMPLLGAELDIKGQIEFDVAKFSLRETPGTLSVLNQMLTIMKTFPQITKVRVEGHTDSDGNAADNLVLSENRAKAVIAWLAGKGIDQGRFSFAGCAAKDPLAPNDTAEHKQKNRRTEFDIELLEGKQPTGYTAPCAHNSFRK